MGHGETGLAHRAARAPPVTPDQFTALARALYGREWRLPLAEALKVNERTVRRWAAGTTAVPDRLWAEMRQLAKDRVAEFRELFAASRP